MFLIFINDLPLEVVSPISLFADDSKIFTKIVSEEHSADEDGFRGDEILQRDLNRIKTWADKWKMEFNVGKCKVMHLGSSNPRNRYFMGQDELAVTTEERDLGVLVDDSLEFDKHIHGVVNKANRMLGLIKIGFNSLDKESFMNIYPVLVRPLLEYCVQVWSPYKQRYISLIERVQERATKLVGSMRHLPYEERLRRLGLTTLVERRHRGDMIETYKILTGREKIDPTSYFRVANERGDPELARGYRLINSNSQRRVPNSERRRNTFSQRVIVPWNRLSRDEVSAPTTSTFKTRFDKRDIERRAQREGRDGRAYNHLYHL